MLHGIAVVTAGHLSPTQVGHPRVDEVDKLNDLAPDRLAVLQLRCGMNFFFDGSHLLGKALRSPLVVVA